ncbi:MAG: hypothetical protein KKA81_17570, partial [Bacteroidetes bacterium]|nr:hypothetical protein [Bacteroidota bacterium]
GAEPTGELLFGEFLELMRRYDKLHFTRMGLPRYSFFNSGEHSISPGYISLTGTWVFKDGTPQGIPIQTSVIELNKNTMSGVEAMSSIFLKGNDSLLTVDIIHWKITKWNTKEIVAENNAPINASYTLTVDLQNEKVYMYRRHKGGKIFGKLVLEPKVLELVDGFRVSSAFYKKRQEEARKLYSPEYKKMLEQLSQTTDGNH